MKQRIQVRDLEAPERIQPAPVQSDTYAKPAQPPINNDLEQLQKGLAAFSSGLNVLGAKQKAEDEKRLKLEQLGAYEAWKASVSSDEHLEAIRAGKLPIQVDKILDTVVKKDGAEKEAMKLAGEIEGDLPTAGLGSTGFDADAYVRSKAQPYVARLARDPRMMAYFGDNLDRIRAGVAKRHQDVLGQLQTQYMEDRGKQEIGRAIVSGLDQKLTPQQVMDQLRDPDRDKGIYAAIGPRNKKGSLDLAYGRMDELTLDVLDTLAEDPRYAMQAVQVLQASRTNSEGASIGPLAAVHKHSAKVDAIAKKARKTMGDFAEKSFKESVLSQNVTDFDKGSLGFSAIRDQRMANPGDPARTMSYSASAQRDEAITEWLNRQRAKTGGVRDTDREVAHFTDMGIKHPELDKVFDEAYKGFLSSNTAREGAPDRLPQIAAIGDEYIKVSERNWSYAKSLVSDDARDFFETYRILRQLGGRSPEAAASETALAFSSSARASDPHIIAGNLKKLHDAIDGIDVKWGFGGEAINGGEIKQQLLPLAKALSRVEGLKAEDIINKSVELIKERSAYVNGRIVISPTLSKDDGQYVQPFLDRIFKEHGAVLREKWQVPDAKHLSIHPVGSHQFIVTKWDGGVVTVPHSYDDKGKPIGTMHLRLSADDIVALRLSGKERASAEAVQKAREWSRPLATPDAPKTPKKSPTERQKDALRSGKGIRLNAPAEDEE